MHDVATSEWAGTGKRNLPPPLRNRFTEIWVAEPSERADLLAVAAACLAGAGPQLPLDGIVDFYVTAKAQAVRHAELCSSGYIKSALYPLTVSPRRMPHCQ